MLSQVTYCSIANLKVGITRPMRRLLDCLRDIFGFFVLNPILSDLAILCKFEFQNLEKNVTLSGNRTLAL